jgi:transcriptional regulator with XRE-family HTH domain
MDAWDAHLQGLGAYIREQRRLAHLSLRDLASRTSLSNAYLSQLERGMNEPSLTVVRAIARALGVPTSTLLTRMGLADEVWEDTVQASPAGAPTSCTTEDAIRTDSRLTEAQKEALLSVYQSYVGRQ